MVVLVLDLVMGAEYGWVMAGVVRVRRLADAGGLQSVAGRAPVSAQCYVHWKRRALMAHCWHHRM
jgi:hypothetical protein